MKCQQPENYLKSIILLLGILMLHTCDKDFDIEEDHLQENNMTLFSDISFNTFKTNVVGRDLGAIAINNLISKETLDLGQLQYTTSSQDYVISIDSTKVLMAEKDGVTSYTFKVHTTDNSKTTNYVLALEDDNVAEFYITYESGSAKVVDPTTGYEVTTQSSGDAIWCPYAEVVEVCADCGSTSCNFDIWGSQFEIVIHYEPCRGDLGGGGSGGESGSNNSGEEEGDSGSGGSTNESSNDLPLDGRAITKELKDLDCPSNYNYYNQNSPFNVDLSTVIGCNDDTIDTSLVEANEKFMCIYNKLTELDSFKDILTNVFGDSEVFNVKFIIVENLKNSKNKPVNGLAVKNDETNYTIKLDKFVIENHSLLFIANLIVHEAIHTNLYARASLESNTILQNEFLSNQDYDYEESFLLHYYANLVVGDDNWQHNFMANSLLVEMSQLTEEFHNLYSDSQFREYQGTDFDWDTLYKDLSISGSLRETNYFSTTYTNNMEQSIVQRVLFNANSVKDLSESNNICEE